MTTLQQDLIDTLAAREISARFVGHVLHATRNVRSSGKNKKQSIEIEFDDPATLEGPRVTLMRGAYGEVYAREAFFEAIRLGQGEDAAIKLARECRANSVYTGAPKGWLEAHGLLATC